MLCLIFLSITSFHRILLSRQKNPPIDEVIEANLVPVFVEFLLFDHCPKLQFESAWVLTNIASGSSDQTDAVIQCGSIPPLVKLLYSTNAEVQEQAVWALGNIAGDGPVLRDLCIECGLMPSLLHVLQPATKVYHSSKLRPSVLSSLMSHYYFSKLITFIHSLCIALFT